MNDPRVDALVRRLDVRHEPPPGLVAATFAAVAPVAERERRADANPWRRAAQTLFPGVARGSSTAARRRALVLMLAALAAASLLWVSLLLAGRQASEPWTPGHVVFGRANPATGAWDIFTIGAHGGGERLLIAGEHDVTRVSHDGRRLASATVGSVVFPSIYSIDGTLLLELHPDPSLNLGAMAWSPDDQWLAFEGWDESDPTRAGVYLMRPDGTGLRRLTFARGIPGDFSPDGTTVVVNREVLGLFVVNVDGTGERQILSMPIDGPGFFPDGRAVYAAVDGHIWRIDLATGATSVIGGGAGDATRPRLDPAGSMFVFALHEDGGASRGIWRIAVDGSRLMKVVDLPGVSEAFPDWAP